MRDGDESYAPDPEKPRDDWSGTDIYGGPYESKEDAQTRFPAAVRDGVELQINAYRVETPSIHVLGQSYALLLQDCTVALDTELRQRGHERLMNTREMTFMIRAVVAEMLFRDLLAKLMKLAGS